MEKGKLFVIDGTDGSGKATQSKLLFERMQKDGYNVRLLSFPNYEHESSALVKNFLNGEFSEAQKYEHPMTFAQQISSFYAVDRVSTFIRPVKDASGNPSMSHLEFYNNGGILICDRYTTSSMIHQTVQLKQTLTERSLLASDVYLNSFMDWLEDFEFGMLGLPYPTEVYYLAVDPETAMRNLNTRYEGDNQKNDILETLTHQKEVFALRDRLIHMRGWQKIDCTFEGKMLERDAIHNILRAHVYAEL